MTTDVFLALLAFTFVGSATPGPNTLMLLASGVNFGFARTIPHIAGIAVGFGSLLLATGFGLGGLLSLYPPLEVALKIAGGCYLLWLAWKIATAGPIKSRDTDARPLTAPQAALFQWVNPKAWAVGVSAMAIYTDPENYTTTALLVVTAFMAMVVPVGLIWCGMGTALRGFLEVPRRLRVFNVMMGVLLVLSLWPMVR